MKTQYVRILKGNNNVVEKLNYTKFHVTTDQTLLCLRADNIAAELKKGTWAVLVNSGRSSTSRKSGYDNFMRPLTPSVALSEIVGSKALTRTMAVKKVWQYIQSHNLQDVKNRRNINADAKLQVVFGKKVVSMFEMTKLMSKHLS